MKIESVGICLKQDQPQAAEVVSQLVAWLSERGLDVLVDEACGALIDRPACDRKVLTAKVDLVIAMGGDGTLLSVARAAGPRSVPILGVNLGRLGFLTEINLGEMMHALELMLAGELEIGLRMRLDVEVVREGKVAASYLALNDAVLTKTALSRMVDLEAYADGVRVTTYHADGLIVSTPTGSTAYSLSAGGPLLLPGIEAIVLTPICPHSLNHRPLVLPESCEIEIVVDARGDEVVLTIDGQAGESLGQGDRVRIRRSDHPVAIVASPDRNRYEILHAKLRWGER